MFFLKVGACHSAAPICSAFCLMLFVIPNMKETLVKLRNVVMVLLACCAFAGAADRKYIVNPRPAGLTGLPFSDAVVVGDTLYIAGHIGFDPKTGQPPADAEEEAKLVMDGISKTVQTAGFSMDDIVSVQVFCTDLKFYDTFNSVYKTHFHGDFPARAFIGTDKLLRGAKYEVLGIAVKRSK
jgi:2-iminobutanoate/2-iminopropanoate deaminase